MTISFLSVIIADMENMNYRQELADEIKDAPKEERQEILDKAKLTVDYWKAREEKLREADAKELSINRAKYQAEKIVFDGIAKAVCEKYGLHIDEEDKTGILASIQRKLRKTSLVFGGADNIKGKRILDLGCGSSGGTEDIDMHNSDYARNMFGPDATRIFEPWYCRALLEVGADPVGIDVGENSNESFEHYGSDLTRKGSLDFLPSKSFDGVWSSAFIGSPQLDKTAGTQDKSKKREIVGELENQISRLLKEDGKRIGLDFEIR